MFNNNYKLAELSDQSDALEAIRQLEQKLSEQIGSPISLVAFETQEDDI